MSFTGLYGHTWSDTHTEIHVILDHLMHLASSTKSLATGLPTSPPDTSAALHITCLPVLLGDFQLPRG